MCLNIQEIISFPHLLFTWIYSFFIWIELSYEAIWWKLETSIAISPLCTGRPNMASQGSSIIHVPQFCPQTTFLIFFLHHTAKRFESVVSNNAFKTGLITVSSKLWPLQAPYGCPLSICLFMSGSGENLMSSKRRGNISYALFFFFFLHLTFRHQQHVMIPCLAERQLTFNRHRSCGGNQTCDFSVSGQSL